MLKVRHLTESLERKLVKESLEVEERVDSARDAYESGDFDYISNEKESLFDFLEENEDDLTPEEYDELYSWYEELENLAMSLNESLNEARNPENEEINALLRQYVAKKNIPNKARKAIEAAGIKIDGEGDSIYFTGPNGKVLSGDKRTFRYGPKAPDSDISRYNHRQGENASWNISKPKASDSFRDSTRKERESKSWDAVDLKGYLDSDRPMQIDWNDRYEQNNPGYMITGNSYDPEDRTDQARSLQPFSGPYRQYKKKRDEAEEHARRHADRGSWIGKDLLTDEEIEAEVDKLRQKLIREREIAQNIISDDNKDYAEADAAMKDIVAKAKAKRQG